VTDPLPRVLLTRAAFNDADATGRAALPAETGGILLGFRAPDLIVITRILVVPDPTRGRRHYLRRHYQAQERMSTERLHLPAVIGYVGEWHTHPADQPPSDTDQDTLSALAHVATGPVCLIVLAYPPNGTTRTHAMTGLRRSSRPIGAARRATVHASTLHITDDSSESLESEASALTERNQS
jgi:integrative and conjugative element protein (TIGR02256 family)